MPVPDFQSIMLPLLKLAEDGEVHAASEATRRLAEQFGLTHEERTELLPSGRQSRFANRVGWAKTYLTKARLLQKEERGTFRITERGRDVLEGSPARIDIAFLTQFPEIEQFRSRTEQSVTEPGETRSQGRTPEEMIEASHRELMDQLADDLLHEVKRRSPEFFEHLVVDLLVRMGYGGSRAEAGRRIGRSGDGGVDGIINEDRLGLDNVYVQAKRWEGTVGRPIVQAFAGSLEGQRARKGVMISTSQSSDEAYEYVRNIEKKIVLIDGRRLVEYMIEYGVGVSEVGRYSVKRVALDELDYFEESAPGVDETMS